jgi:hypothetical protein
MILITKVILQVRGDYYLLFLICKSMTEVEYKVLPYQVALWFYKAGTTCRHSLPQDILDQLKDYRFIQEEKKEDSEVEDCFRNDLPTTPRSKVSGSPGTPRSKYSASSSPRYLRTDDNVRFPNVVID